MARQAQTPGGAYVNEVATEERQVPGYFYVNETVSVGGGGSRLKTYNAITNARLKTFNGITAARLKTFNSISNV